MEYRAGELINVILEYQYEIKLDERLSLDDIINTIKSILENTDNDGNINVGLGILEKGGKK